MRRTARKPEQALGVITDVALAALIQVCERSPGEALPLHRQFLLVLVGTREGPCCSRYRRVTYRT